MSSSRHALIATAALAVATAPLTLTTITAGAERADAATVPAGWTVRSTTSFRSVTDATGAVWSPRLGQLPVSGTSTRLVGKDVLGTTNDKPYQTNAFGARGYKLAVPGPGRYTVRLLMAEDWFASAGKRVFSVSAEGKTVFASVDIAKAVGKNKAYDLTFTTDVTDGSLAIDFAAIKDAPLISGVQVTYAGAASGGTTGGGVPTTPVPAPVPAPSGQAVRFSPNSFWTQSIRKAPLAANSALQASTLANQVAARYGGVASFNAYQYNQSFYTVPAGTPKVDVTWFDCQKKGSLPANIYTGAAYFKQVPIPAKAVPANGTDSTLSIYDPAADKYWEFWQASKTATGWKACWGGRIDSTSSNLGMFPRGYGAAATNLAGAGGMITIADIKRGYINHAMNLAITSAAPWTQYSWPAQRSDGAAAATSPILEGTRVRLDPSINVDSLNLSPIGKMVAKAAQEYGFIVTNLSGAVTVSTESGQATKLATGVNPWDNLLGGMQTYQVLKNFPWSKTQFLPRDYGKPTK